MSNFKVKINGKVRSITHTNRHKCNSRSVNLIKFLEHLKENNLLDSSDVINAFKTGYNIGYRESKKRSRELVKQKKEVISLKALCCNSKITTKDI